MLVTTFSTYIVHRPRILLHGQRGIGSAYPPATICGHDLAKGDFCCMGSFSGNTSPSSLDCASGEGAGTCRPSRGRFVNVMIFSDLESRRYVVVRVAILQRGCNAQPLEAGRFGFCQAVVAVRFFCRSVLPGIHQ